MGGHDSEVGMPRLAFVHSGLRALLGWLATFGDERRGNRHDHELVLLKI
jgi:hypothetical protein